MIDVQALIAANIIDNNAGLITPAKLREVLLAMDEHVDFFHGFLDITAVFNPLAAPNGFDNPISEQISTYVGGAGVEVRGFYKATSFEIAGNLIGMPTSDPVLVEFKAMHGMFNSSALLGIQAIDEFWDLMQYAFFQITDITGSQSGVAGQVTVQQLTLKTGQTKGSYDFKFNDPIPHNFRTEELLGAATFLPEMTVIQIDPNGVYDYKSLNVGGNPQFFQLKCGGSYSVTVSDVLIDIPSSSLHVKITSYWGGDTNNDLSNQFQINEIEGFIGGGSAVTTSTTSVSSPYTDYLISIPLDRFNTDTSIRRFEVQANNSDGSNPSIIQIIIDLDQPNSDLLGSVFPSFMLMLEVYNNPSVAIPNGYKWQGSLQTQGTLYQFPLSNPLRSFSNGVLIKEGKDAEEIGVLMLPNMIGQDQINVGYKREDVFLKIDFEYVSGGNPFTAQLQIPSVIDTIIQ